MSTTSHSARARRLIDSGLLQSTAYSRTRYLLDVSCSGVRVYGRDGVALISDDVSGSMEIQVLLGSFYIKTALMSKIQ